ncbi:hypothetical protein K4L06_05585 [Lysobacter sp. BMK333-48F3]|uniref:hypothetical protein n=1 Tax=Lysobacter sp. BMK333-48F3 TaxID=2867962 RepID=UPI001C8C3617|nr:hypothetical protein [Lysobacter sp. BMK333-48F3]MBX9400776.1 hypothetical protein [Lysobacter sp. BMK333-48F3]
MNLIEWAATIPNVIWSGVIASIITLAGVMLSNWSNTNRLAKQLRHDASEKQKDRNATLRREVYLRAVEEFARASHQIGKLPNIDPKKVNLADGFQDLFVIAAKLQLVSSAPTARLVGELTTTYGELLLEMIEVVRPLHDVQTDIDTISEAHSRYVDESKRILAAITQFNESARTESAVFEALCRSYEYSQGQAERHSEHKIALMEKRTELSYEFSRSVIPVMKRIAEVQAPVMVAIRQELDLDGDIGDFKAQSAENLVRIESAMDKALQRMEEQSD